MVVRVKVRFFSLYSDVAEDTVFVLEDGCSLNDLYRLVVSKYSGLEDLFKRIKPVVLVNGVSRGFNHVLCDGDEVAFIPPVSGG